MRSLNPGSALLVSGARFPALVRCPGQAPGRHLLPTQRAAPPLRWRLIGPLLSTLGGSEKQCGGSLNREG